MTGEAHDPEVSVVIRSGQVSFLLVTPLTRSGQFSFELANSHFVGQSAAAGRALVT
jgi:hypothetical protein